MFMNACLVINGGHLFAFLNYSLLRFVTVGFEGLCVRLRRLFQLFTPRPSLVRRMGVVRVVALGLHGCMGSKC